MTILSFFLCRLAPRQNHLSGTLTYNKKTHLVRLAAASVLQKWDYLLMGGGCALNCISFSMVSARLLCSSNPSLSAKSNNGCCEASVVWLKLFLCVWLSSSLVTTHTHEKKNAPKEPRNIIVGAFASPPRSPLFYQFPI